MSPTRLILAVNLVAALLVCSSPLWAKDNATITRLAETLATLRGDVDAKERQLDTQRRQDDAKTASLIAELEGLNMQAERASARAASLNDVVRARRAKLNAQAGRQDTLRDAVLQACDAIEQSIAQTSPLHRDARVKRVSDLRARIQARDVLASKGLEELVVLVRDELELSGTTQLTKHVLTLDAKQRRLPVVALGTALMYWKTEEGTAGVLARQDGQWSMFPVTSPQGVRAIEALYKAEETSSTPTILSLPLPVRSTAEDDKETTQP